jgi:hypothetical protein
MNTSMTPSGEHVRTTSPGMLRISGIGSISLDNIKRRNAGTIPG